VCSLRLQSVRAVEYEEREAELIIPFSFCPRTEHRRDKDLPVSSGPKTPEKEYHLWTYGSGKMVPSEDLKKARHRVRKFEPTP
jgi:hypothetical protein